MYALIGLGNPGRRYENTRHNIGYLVVDHLAAVDKIPFIAGKGDYYYKELIYRDQSVGLFKPTTYMNRSGVAVKNILNFFNIPIENMLLICDDFNLPFGMLRFRKKGSDGGHNGLNSVIYHLQTEDFNRFRFGIGDNFSDSMTFVLENFNKKEFTQLNDLLPVSTKAIQHWIEYGIEKTMNKYNRQFINENGQ